jgi:hypothetical protein
MDIAIHWGLFRYLIKGIRENPIIPLIALGLDVIILWVLVAQRLFMITHTHSDGLMYMEMEMTGEDNMKPQSGKRTRGLLDISATPDPELSISIRQCHQIGTKAVGIPLTLVT